MTHKYASGSGLRVLDTGEDGPGMEGQVASMYGWSDHTLPVTGLLAGSGGPSAIVVSCSLDHTCKVSPASVPSLLSLDSLFLITYMVSRISCFKDHCFYNIV